MKSISILAILLFSITASVYGGIEFFEGSWEEALAEAKAQDKIIFMDAYAVWCGPCKRMAKTVFTDEEVGKFYNDKFINVKMDMEKGEGIQLRSKYRVMAYPTLLYIDYTGEVVQKVKGARGVDAFIELGKKALLQVDRSDAYAAEYEKGKRDPEFVYNYIRALNNAGKPSTKVANEYLYEQKDLTTEQNLKLILEAATHADSRIFELLIEYRKQIAALTSEEVVKDRIKFACDNTVLRAIEFESRDLLEQAQNKMKEHYPEMAKTFEIEKEMAFCLEMKNVEGYLDACKDYVKKAIKDDPEALNELALDIRRNFNDHVEAMKEAEDIAEKAAKSDSDFKYYLTYARILEENGKKSEALKAMKNCLELATEEKDKVMIQRITDRMRG